MRALIAATAAAALMTAPAALAVTPKGGVELYGHTSLQTKKEWMFMTVSPSGERLSVFIGVIDNVIPPRLKNVKISDAGKFSATREVISSSGTEWTIKIRGKFTAPTRAKGTFSAEGVTHRGGGSQPASSHGTQTFKVHFFKNADPVGAALNGRPSLGLPCDVRRHPSSAAPASA